MVEIRGAEIVLSAEDSIRFFEEIRNPNRVSLRQRDRFFKELDSDLTFTRTDNGFCARFADLDLSFLDEESEDRSVAYLYNCGAAGGYSVNFSTSNIYLSESILKAPEDYLLRPAVEYKSAPKHEVAIFAGNVA